MSIITINNTGFDPSEMTIGVSDISGSDSGRDQTGKMYKNRIGTKYKISLSWWCPTPAETSTILTAVSPEYFDVTFTDPVSNSTKTKTFYVGDRSAPVKWWRTNNKRYNKVSFNLIER